MSKELGIVIYCQIMNKSQCIEASLEFWISIFFERVLIVVNVLTYSVPADSLYVLDFVWVAKDLHTKVVKWVSLREVDDVEADFHAFRGIAYSEEEPLRMSICVYVILKNQVVFGIRLLDDS